MGEKQKLMIKMDDSGLVFVPSCPQMLTQWVCFIVNRIVSLVLSEEVNRENGL